MNVMPQPTVSIVIPSYNQAAFLEQTLDSVFAQEYPLIETLLIDGASTDGSLEIIKKYASRLTWWTSEKDSGQAEAINKGFARARGGIIAWLNSDDAYLPGAIACAVEVFQANPEAALVYGNMLAVNEHNQIINRLKYRQVSLADLLCFEIIGQPAVFLRREALEKAGFLDPAYQYLLDHHLWIRIAALGKIVHVDQTWAQARYHPAAKNRARAAEFGQEAFRILDWAQAQPALDEIVSRQARRARASAYRVNARYLLDGGQARASLASWMRALWLHPPTALRRLNLLFSGLLDITGLRRVRAAILLLRKRWWKA